MDITKVALQEDGSYHVNDSMFVPDDMSNRHRVMVQEWIDAGGKITPYVEPEKSWTDKRTASMADGGYGTWSEQLEMIGEQGMDVYQAHIAKVKSDHPKPLAQAEVDEAQQEADEAQQEVDDTTSASNEDQGV